MRPPVSIKDLLFHNYCVCLCIKNVCRAAVLQREGVSRECEGSVNGGSSGPQVSERLLVYPCGRSGFPSSAHLRDLHAPPFSSFSLIT